LIKFVQTMIPERPPEEGLERAIRVGRDIVREGSLIFSVILGGSTPIYLIRGDIKSAIITGGITCGSVAVRLMLGERARETR
jgi:small neutral amino acid transporter SnatA (MarC family)